MCRLNWLVESCRVVFLLELLCVNDEQVAKIVVVFAVGLVRGFASD